MHRATSLTALPAITNPGAVLVDGDHNWYTVFHELQLLDQNCKQWPVTLHHDIGWPYGRRDMYYDPDTIPVDYRQPFRRSGIVYGQSALAAGGVNDEVFNARHEGGPRNGVLTAIEDFMDSTQRDLELFAASGLQGLGLLIDGATLESSPSICEVVEDVHDTTFSVAISPRYASRYFSQDIRLTRVAEADALPLRDSLADLLAPDVSIGRLELLPGSSRPVRDWYPRALPIAGGARPPWWSDEPVLASDPLFLFRVPDAYYMPRFGAVISSDGQVFETSVEHALYHTPDMALLPEVSVQAGLPYLSRKRVDAPSLDRAVVTLPWGAANNYGHFLLDCLSGLAAVSERPELHGYKPVFPELHPWQKRHLDLLGIDDHLELDGDLYHIRDVVFCSSMVSALHAPNISYRMIRERQLTRIQNGSRAPSKIYLARTPSPKRNFLTEHRLRAEVARLGFEIIFPEQLPIDEQIAVFNRADIIVGCTGAAFANALYCKEDAQVVEIIPMRMVVPRLISGGWVSNICTIVGCQWRPYFCVASWPTNSLSPGEEDRAELNTTFELDVDDFMQYLTELGRETQPAETPGAQS
jgi:capsular polysaccharide biosynthesis protein